MPLTVSLTNIIFIINYYKVLQTFPTIELLWKGKLAKEAKAIYVLGC